jgi:hypothetical protein
MVLSNNNCCMNIFVELGEHVENIKIIMNTREMDGAQGS